MIVTYILVLAVYFDQPSKPFDDGVYLVIPKNPSYQVLGEYSSKAECEIQGEKEKAKSIRENRREADYYCVEKIR